MGLCQQKGRGVVWKACLVLVSLVQLLSSSDSVDPSFPSVW